MSRHPARPLAGGALGLAVAHFGVTLIVKFLGDQLPKSADVYPDVWVLAFTLGISVFAGLVAGLLPAMRLTKADDDTLRFRVLNLALLFNHSLE